LLDTMWDALPCLVRLLWTTTAGGGERARARSPRTASPAARARSVRARSWRDWHALWTLLGSSPSGAV